MRISIFTKDGAITIDLPESNLHRYELNQYSEQVVEYYR